MKYKGIKRNIIVQTYNKLNYFDHFVGFGLVLVLDLALEDRTGDEFITELFPEAMLASSN